MKKVEVFVTGCIDRGYITAEKAPWLQYALEKRITSLTALIPLLLIGTMISSLPETIAFYFGFFKIRRYTNGVHASSFIKCLFWSVISESIFLGLLPQVVTPVSGTVLLLVSGILIWSLAPYNHPNILLSSKEVAACAASAKKSSVQLTVVISVLCICGFEYLAAGVLLGYVMAATMLLIAYIPKGRKNNAEEGTKSRKNGQKGAQ